LRRFAARRAKSGFDVPYHRHEDEVQYRCATGLFRKSGKMRALRQFKRIGTRSVNLTLVLRPDKRETSSCHFARREIAKPCRATVFTGAFDGRRRRLGPAGCRNVREARRKQRGALFIRPAPRGIGRGPSAEVAIGTR